MSALRDKHPSWFKLKTERRQLIKELPPETAVTVLLACLDYLEIGSFPDSMHPIERIAASAFLPDLEEAWAKYTKRVSNGSKGGAPKGNKNAQKTKQPYGCIRPHMGPFGVEVEEDPLKGDSSNRDGEPPLCGGGPPTRFYVDNATGKVVDRGEACAFLHPSDGCRVGSH